MRRQRHCTTLRLFLALRGSSYEELRAGASKHRARAEICRREWTVIACVCTPSAESLISMARQHLKASAPLTHPPRKNCAAPSCRWQAQAIPKNDSEHYLRNADLKQEQLVAQALPSSTRSTIPES
jgi:hypothetical protein